jgi:hypothetical protein
MRKIPTLYRRGEDMRYVTRDVSPAATWVLAGEGRATRKFDGTCMRLDEHGRWWARREVKQGKPHPPQYQVEETDPVTGKTVGWEPVTQSPFVKAWNEAMTDPELDGEDLTAGTYELCGPKVNGNPEGFPRHVLVPHGAEILEDAPRDYDGLAKYLAEFPGEGIVWWHEDGRRAKLKRKDIPR